MTSMQPRFQQQQSQFGSQGPYHSHVTHQPAHQQASMTPQSLNRSHVQVRQSQPYEADTSPMNYSHNDQYGGHNMGTFSNAVSPYD